MESYKAMNRLGETIEIKRNAAGMIVAIHSDYDEIELVPFQMSLTGWGLVDPATNSLVITDPYESGIIERGVMALRRDE
ncbi:MAG: hypothetical protein M1434_00905 [Chloroflexi bacterium]|nr:hypothetical protein [Chloroflexota bacterium]MCL5273290.1 hypothetical protein [Chloroflexota bacterium]